MNTTLNTTKGLALKGVMARSRGNHESFVKGSLSGDRLVLIYASVRSERISVRKCQKVHSTRIVQCERRFTPEGDDFWWYGVQQNILSHVL